MLEVLRKYANATPAWITDSHHFAEFLDLAYSANFHGEVWLYNNDLKVISDEETFRTLYLNGIFGDHWGKVSAVKVLVSRGHQDDVFSSDGSGSIPSKQLRERLLTLAKEKDGEAKIQSLLFGRLPPPDQAGELGLVPDYSTVVFYLHGNSLQKTGSSGIVMIRPHIFPFFGEEKEPEYAAVWQLVDQPQILNMRLLHFNDIFSHESAAYHHVVLDQGAPRLVPGLPSSYHPGDTETSRDGLLLGQDTDYLILASNPEEMDALTQAFHEHITQTPLGDRFSQLAVVRKFNDMKKLVFGITGEGNTLAAVKTWEAIELWRPREVIFVGMAGGDPQGNGTTVGDIVVGEQIVRYEHATIRERTKTGGRAPWEYDFRRERWGASDLKIKAHELALRFRPVLSLFAKATLRRTARDIRVLIQPIASGNKLVLSPSYFQMLQDNVDTKIAAVEMESDGVGQACELRKLKLLVIRGIMDRCTDKSRGDEPSRRDTRKATSEIIAQFVRELLIGK